MSPSGCYTRIGTSSQPMTTAMIDDLYARRKHTTLRNILSPRQNLKFAQLKIYYQEHGLELNKQFASSLDLLTPDEKYNYIAYLLADENGVSIKVAKYAGTDKVDLIENEEYGYCSLVKATNRVLDKLKIENVTHTKITSTRRIDKNLVEPVAMREAIVNCIVHNDFSREIPPVFEIFNDRIVMTSYGGLIQGQSLEDFFSCSSMPRNRGSKNFDEPANEPINEPVNEPLKVSLSDSEKKVLEVIKHYPEDSKEQIVEKIGKSRATVTRAISGLVKKKKIYRVGSAKTGHWGIEKENEE